MQQSSGALSPSSCYDLRQQRTPAPYVETRTHGNPNTVYLLSSEKARATEGGGSDPIYPEKLVEDVVYHVSHQNVANPVFKANSYSHHAIAVEPVVAAGWGETRIRAVARKFSVHGPGDGPLYVARLRYFLVNGRKALLQERVVFVLFARIIRRRGRGGGDISRGR